MDKLHEHTQAPHDEGLHRHAQVTPERTLASRLGRFLIPLGSLAIGTTELATGGFSSPSVPDGLENVGEVITYPMHANAGDPNRQARLRKLTYGIIGATALGVSAKAGIDLGLGHESAPDPATIYATAASLAWKGLHFFRMRRSLRRTGNPDVSDQDLIKHLKTDTFTAGLALAGAVLQGIIPGVGEAAAFAGGLFGAYSFRLTKENLADGHNHAPHSETHEHHVVEALLTPQKSWLARLRHPIERRYTPSRLRLAMGVGTASLALVGVMSGTAHEDGHVATQPMPSASASTFGPEQAHIFTPHRVESAPTTPTAAWRCVTIKSSDSEWGIIAQQTAAVTKQQPSVLVVNAVTMLTALKNERAFPDPNYIDAGDCLEVPTPAATRLFYGAVETNSPLAADLQALNEQSTITAVLGMHQTQAHIETDLQHALAQPA